MNLLNFRLMMKKIRTNNGLTQRHEDTKKE